MSKEVTVQDKDKAEYEILKGNLLICNFMDDGVMPVRAKYHTSWDWIMAVVEKINKWVDDKSDNYNLDYFEMNTTILDLKITESIDVVWNYSIQFIQWYNQQNQNP